MSAAPYRWVESTLWEVPFFGLPQRIPWPAEVPPELANQEPFEIEHVLAAIVAMGAGADQFWLDFRAAANLLEDLAEALEDHEVVHAQRLLEQFETLHPGTAFADYHRGMVARLEGLEEEALAFYRTAAEKTPRVAPIWHNIGTLLAMREDREGAIDAFRRVLHISPRNGPALEGLAALRAVVKLQKDPKDPQSIAFIDIPTYGKMAADQLNQVANDPDELLNRGEQLLRDGMLLELGAKAIQRALQLRPDHPRSLFAMAAACRLNSQHEGALQAMARFTELYPTDPQGFFQMAQICNALDDSAGERAALSKVLELDPNNQPSLGLYFQLSPSEHDPAKEEKLSAFGAERQSWMAYILASDLARRRADARSAVKWAECAFEINSEVEEVLLQYTSAIGDARDFSRLASVIRPRIESGRHSFRVGWNYAQVLQQMGLGQEARAVLRKVAAIPNLPPALSEQASLTLEAWAGFVAGGGVRVEAHDNGFLVRPVLLKLADGDGGVVLNAGAPLPADGAFPWRVNGVEGRIEVQQGHSEASAEPRPLGTFALRSARPGSAGHCTVECHLTAMPDGALHFRAAQDGRKLPVTWSAAGIAK